MSSDQETSQFSQSNLDILLSNISESSLSIQIRDMENLTGRIVIDMDSYKLPKVSTIVLSNLKNVTHVDIRDPSMQIKNVSINGTRMESFDSKLPELIFLNLGYNQLKTLDLTDYPKLEKVNVQYNRLHKLNNIPVSINSLNISNNSFDIIEVGNLTELRELNCENNSGIHVLNIPRNAKLILDNDPLSIFTWKNDPNNKPVTSNNSTKQYRTLDIPTQDYNIALRKYFQLKSEYETKLLEKRTAAFKKGTTKNDRKQRVAMVRPQCVICKRPVGSVFKFDPERRLYIARCGDTNTPCAFKIKLYAGTYLMHDQSLHMFRDRLEQLRSDVIVHKMNTLFKYIDEQTSSQRFTHLMQDYEMIRKLYTDELDTYEEHHYSKLKSEEIRAKLQRIYDIKTDMTKSIVEYEKSKNRAVLQMAIDTYIREYIPEVNNLRLLKYEIMEMNYPTQSSRTNVNVETVSIMFQKDIALLKMEDCIDEPSKVIIFNIGNKDKQPTEDFDSDDDTTNIVSKSVVNIPKSSNPVSDNEESYEQSETQSQVVHTDDTEQGQVLTSYLEAYNIALPYLQNAGSQVDLNIKDVPNIYKVPTESQSPIWKMTPEALENTLKYIMEYLCHSCYLLCVKDNVGELFKLETKKTADVYKPIFQRAIDDVAKNTTLTERQKSMIQSRLQSGKPLRVMQCVIKEYSDETTFTQEYQDLFDGLTIPNGVYILNLTDAVILRQDGKHPFQMVVGQSADIGAFKSLPFIPIFSLSGQKGYYDIPFPNYDDVSNIIDGPTIQTRNFNTDFSKKRSQAVFRGGPTGCGYTPETNSRLKLATIESPLLDVGISGKGYLVNTNNIRFDPVYGLGMLNTNIKSSQKFMTMEEQSQYKYIIHVDGNVNAYRLLTTMATGSVILRVESEYVSWFDHIIKPNVHYIPVRADLSDLLDVINNCEANPDMCNTISQNAVSVANALSTEDAIKSIVQTEMQELSCFDHSPVTQQEVATEE